MINGFWLVHPVSRGKRSSFTKEVGSASLRVLVSPVGQQLLVFPFLTHAITLLGSFIQTTVTEYAHLDVYGWIQLKQSLMEFLQGQRVKVRLFVRMNSTISPCSLVSVLMSAQFGANGYI